MRQYLRGFSLIELLVVIAVIGILAALTVPALSSISTSMGVARGGQLVGDQMALARQVAASRNTMVEVRFLKNVADVNKYSAVQIWQYDSTGDNPKPYRRLESLPQAISVESSTSPLLANAGATLSGSTNFGSQGERSYVAVRFRANGRLETTLSFGQTYLTIQSEREPAASPANYYTLQINPLTGRIASFRP